MANNDLVEAKQSPMERITEAVSDPVIGERLQATLGVNKSESFKTSLIELYSGDTKLRNCNPKLVVVEALKAASLGLTISKALGHASILPFANVPTLVIGWKGWWRLAMNTGAYKYLNVDKYYDGELSHECRLTGEIEMNGERKSDAVAGYFAHFVLINGFTKTIKMTIDEAIAHGAKYAPRNPMWKSHINDMGMKTVLKRLIQKYGVISTEMEMAINMERGIGDDFNEDYMQEEPPHIGIEAPGFAPTEPYPGLPDGVEPTGEVVDAEFGPVPEDTQQPDTSPAPAPAPAPAPDPDPDPDPAPEPMTETDDDEYPDEPEW